MTQLKMRYLGLVVPLLLPLGCNVFDEKLIPTESSGDQQFADECKQATVPVASFNDYHEVDLTSFKSDLENLPDCLNAPLAHGRDFFMAVDMVQGQKWHFHAKGKHATTAGSVEELDPAVYIVTGCNDIPRNCADGTYAVNNCGSGLDEHLTFLAPSSQTYYVGVDYVGTDELPSDGNVEVVAVQAVCGNGVQEHPEFCDDGNTNPGDGCDQCRQALQSGDAEKVSKNDGPLDATILLLDPNQLAALSTPYTFTVTGTLASNCDFDFYELDLSGQSSSTKVTAELTGTGSLCSHADLKLDPNQFTPFELGAGSSSCPITSTLNLKPGKHLVRVASLASVMPPLSADEDKAYTLRLTFAAP